MNRMGLCHFGIHNLDHSKNSMFDHFNDDFAFMRQRNNTSHTETIGKCFEKKNSDMVFWRPLKWNHRKYSCLYQANEMAFVLSLSLSNVEKDHRIVKPFIKHMDIFPTTTKNSIESRVLIFGLIFHISRGFFPTIFFYTKRENGNLERKTIGRREMKVVRTIKKVQSFSENKPFSESEF